MSSNTNRSWLIGSNGIFHGDPAEGWHRIGTFDYHVNALMDRDDELIAGVTCGLWKIDRDSGRWTQLHDETLTEVLCIESIDTEKHLVGCPYGIATERTVENDAVRWRFLSDTLRVNERFTNMLHRIGDGNTYFVGTEAGLLIYDADSEDFARTSLTGFPVRALVEAENVFFAGTDGHGIWRSDDGETWHPAGYGIDSRDVLCLAFDGESIVGGSDRGFFVGSGSSHWTECGPSVLVSTIAADTAMPERWLAGCKPSGLWWTEDGGKTFAQTGAFNYVGAILSPTTSAGGAK